MPALNEEKNIKAAINATLDSLDNFNITGELVIVNDGSSDKTGAIVQEYANTEKRISTIHHDHPKGIGVSFWDGLQS